MKEQVVVANPYNEEHIYLLEKYEAKNNLTHTTTQYLKNTKKLMSEIDYRQLEQETPEIVKTLFLQENGNIITVLHLIGEKDRKICRMTIDNTSNFKHQEKLLEEAENYAFTTLGMEEIIILQEKSRSIPSNYFKNRSFEDLGMESNMQVYMKSRSSEIKDNHTNYQI